MPLALDISNWGGELSADTVAAWKQKGVSKVIVGVSHKVNLARQQLDTVIAGGLPVEAYCYFYWGQDTATQPAYVRSAISGLNVGRLWLDFEDDGAPKDDPQAVREWIHSCVVAGERLNLPLGIYTGWWWWSVWPDDTADFCDYPLWVAAYDGQPNLDFPPFGGWQKCAMKQYAGTTDFCGYRVDLDWYEEDEMTDEEKLRLACLELANRWASMIRLGQAQQVVDEAKALGVVAA